MTVKDANLVRLRRIEGQIRGLQRMLEQDRCCPEVIAQIASVQQALRGVGRAVVRNHLTRCATKESYDETLDLVYKHLR
jgi:CsoR family transcriptional regulator, copper-sensing transcriptional repressor